MTTWVALKKVAGYYTGLILYPHRLHDEAFFCSSVPLFTAMLLAQQLTPRGMLLLS